MTLNEYQWSAERTLNGNLTWKEMQIMCLLGLAGEVGEVVDYLKKVLFHGHELDNDKLIEETGDCLWYLAGLCTMFGINLDDVAAKNIKKLRKRYPDGFSCEKSINRME